MTNIRKQEYTGTLPERFGGSFLFRARYLESSWVKFIFRTLIYAAAVMLVMTAVAGKVSQWQSDYLQQSLTRVETELTFLSGRQTAAELAGDLTGQADALDRQITLLQQKQELLNMAQEDTLPVLAEIEDRSQTLHELKGVIADTYGTAQALYGQDDTIGALRLFQTVSGYEDAALWSRLCGIRVRQEAARSLFAGYNLTAWVQQMRLLQQLSPGKAETLPVSFGALQGIWLCRDDQQVHMRQLTTENGDGRAGEEASPVRCLMAEGDALYGCLAEGMPLDVNYDDFTETVASGGILRVQDAEDNKDPAAAVLVLQTEDGRENVPKQITVISENIIQVQEGAWEGIYYRLLED